jgi:hypothetical protein
MRCSTPLRRCSPSRAARARRERECHLYFARRVTFLSCVDNLLAAQTPSGRRRLSRGGVEPTPTGSAHTISTSQPQPRAPLDRAERAGRVRRTLGGGTALAIEAPVGRWGAAVLAAGAGNDDDGGRALSAIRAETAVHVLDPPVEPGTSSGGSCCLSSASRGGFGGERASG